MTNIVTLTQVLQDASVKLSAISDTPLLDAEVLLAHVLVQQRSYLRAWPDAVLTEAQLKQFHALLSRRMNAEPIAYLIGHKEFWSLDLEVNASTLVPRPETELLIETALQLFPDPQQRIKMTDLGTGSGAIALALASERPLWDIQAVDISESALTTARNNAQRLGLARVSFYLSNWFTALPAGEFDLVISNPPYISEEEWPTYEANLAGEPRSALVSGKDGLDAIRAIVSDAPHRIRSGGYILIEHGLAQGPAVCALLMMAGAHDVKTLFDLAGLERVTLGQF